MASAALRYYRYIVAGKTFYIETFGCQMNVHDSERMHEVLRRAGYAEVEASSAEVGSSKSITFGFMASARAMAARCCCPPES